MHEGNFTNQIVDAILTELKNHPSGKPRRVQVKVGDMLHLNIDSVQAHYAMATKGTPLETAKLVLEESPTRVKCRTCSKEWEPEDHHLLFCDDCQKTEVDITSGNQVVIEAIDLDV